MMLLRVVTCCIFSGTVLAFQFPLARCPLPSNTRCSLWNSDHKSYLLPPHFTLRPSFALSAGKSGLWTPDDKPTELWTPRGVVQVEEVPQDEMTRPLLDSEWEIMFAASEDLRNLAKSGQLMQELTSSGEDLGGVDVTEIGLRPTGDALDLDEVFRKWKELLGTGEYNPSMAPLTSQMISACIRKGPQSWLEGLAALQVLGFNPDSFIFSADKDKIVNLDAMAFYLSGTLMNLDIDAIKSDASILSTKTKAQVQDLVVSVSRIILRYSLLQDVLKRKPKAGGISLSVISRAVPACLETEQVLLPENAAANILMSDFTPGFELEEAEANVDGVEVEAIRVSSQQVDAWLAAQLRA